MYARRRGRDAREGRDILAGPSCKITTGSGNDEQTAARRGKFTCKAMAASRGHVSASHATPRIALAKMMASVSDSIRALTGVFTTLLQIMSDEPASSSWLPDADALDRPCRILFAIAVISDNLHATAEPFPSRLGLLLFSRWGNLTDRPTECEATFITWYRVPSAQLNVRYRSRQVGRWPIARSVKSARAPYRDHSRTTTAPALRKSGNAAIRN
jgi:hypothetical protein